MLFDITDDLSYEIYALVILQTPLIYANEIYTLSIGGKTLGLSCLNKAESPDWQSAVLNLGIEVTIGMSEAEIVDSKTFGNATKDAKDIEDVKSRLSRLDKKGVFKGEVSQQGGFYIMGHDQPDNLGLLERVIRKKVSASKKYANFSNNWLFIYFVGSLQKDKVLGVIKSIPGHEFFTRYIINPLGNDDGIWYIDAPYQEVVAYRHFGMSNEMIMEKVDKVRRML